MIKRFHWIFILVCLSMSCVEIDTASPQASSSISESKRSGFYLSKARMLRPGLLDMIDSVWTERVWRYEIVKGEKHKIPLWNNQIVLSLKSGKNHFKNSDFLKWEVTEKRYGIFGSGNGVYILRCPKNEKIDTLQFFLHNKSDSSVKDMGTFLID